MRKLLLLLILSASTFASAQEINELTYDDTNNTFVMNQTPYELFGEPDLLWGDVVRRHYVASTLSFRPRPMARDGRTFTVVIDQYGLQPERQFVNYGRTGEYGINTQTFQPFGITTVEMSMIESRYEAEFTVPSEGSWDVWYTSINVSGGQSGSGADTFVVE